jgi:uncharacterized protein
LQSALQIALSHGHIALAKLMVESGADVNRAAGSSTPLMEAASFGSLEAVEYLLQHKADPSAAVVSGRRQAATADRAPSAAAATCTAIGLPLLRDACVNF